VLDGVTIESSLRVFTGTLSVNNGLTLNGTLTLGTQDAGVGTVLLGPGSALAGTGEVISTSRYRIDSTIFGDTIRATDNNGEVRIGPGIKLRGGFEIGNRTAPGRVVNEGTIIGPARIEDLGLAFLQIYASEFENLGTVEALAPSILNGIIPDVSINADLTINRGSFIVRTDSELALYGAMRNEGTIETRPRGGVSVFKPADYANGVLRGGRWIVGPDSTIRLYGANISILDATLVLCGANSLLTTGDNSIFALAGLTTIAEGGALSLLGSRDSSTASALQNAGRLGLGAGSVLSVNGAYTQTARGILDVSIADEGNSGRIAATNTASLNGNLFVSPAPGYIPASGSTFEVLSASAINDQFAQTQFSGFDPGLQLDVVYGNTTITVQTTRTHPLGDADRDGDVDRDDYGVWRATFGSAADLRADFNGNGVIDAADYAVWRDNSTLLPAPLLGDYNRNGAVDASDYVAWRDTLGPADVSPFSGADGDGDGAVTQNDFSVWRANFGNAQSPASAASLLGPATVPDVVSRAGNLDHPRSIGSPLLRLRCLIWRYRNGRGPHPASKVRGRNLPQ
jgi:hypothetical protein